MASRSTVVSLAAAGVLRFGGFRILACSASLGSFSVAADVGLGLGRSVPGRESGGHRPGAPLRTSLFMVKPGRSVRLSDIPANALLGVSLGGENLQRSLAVSNLRPWPLWLLLGLATFVAHWFFSGSASLRSMPAWLGNGALAIVFTLCCAFTSLASLGAARSLARAPWPVAASLSENSYGIYILHYPFVTWMQFSLLSQPWPAALKFAIVFPLALAGSWVTTARLRRTAARRVL